MTPESEALLNALVPAEGAVSTDHTDAVYDLLVPLHDILAKTESHLTALDSLRIAADRAETDPKVYGWFERFKQSIDAGRRLNADAKRSVEAISDLCFQLDNYALEMRRTLTTKFEAAEKSQRVTMLKTEADALRASATQAHAELTKALRELNALRDHR